MSGYTVIHDLWLVGISLAHNSQSQSNPTGSRREVSPVWATMALQRTISYGLSPEHWACGCFGSNDFGQCTVPDLDEDTTYLHISAGAYAYCASLK